MSAHPNERGDTDRQTSGLEPAASTGRHVEVNGLRLHYLDYGNEGLPPMLCIHGGGAHGHWFDYVAAGFTSRYHVRALDLRGHGDSDWTEPPDYRFDAYAADVAAFSEKLDLRDFVLIGHSMGGMVSLVHTVQHPGRVRKLVVVDTRTLMSAERIAKMRDFGTKPARSYATREELVSRYRLEPAGTQMAAPDVLRHIAERSARQQPDGTWRHKFDRRVYATFERRDGMPLWEKVTIPALLVKGALSGRISAEMYEEVKKRAPQVKLAEVPDSDHHVTLDNPSVFIEAVSAFLED
jgi:pimeloyl-ACP methyl ester carboxylesterase